MVSLAKPNNKSSPPPARHREPARSARRAGGGGGIIMRRFHFIFSTPPPWSSPVPATRPVDKTCRRDLSTSSSRVAQVESLGIFDKGEENCEGFGIASSNVHSIAPYGGATLSGRLMDQSPPGVGRGISCTLSKYTTS